MNEPLGVIQALSVLIAMAVSWSCHRAGRTAPHSQIAWHALSVFLLLRALNGALRMYSPEWRPFEIYVTPLLLIATSLSVAMIARASIIVQKQLRALSSDHTQGAA